MIDHPQSDSLDVKITVSMLNCKVQDSDLHAKNDKFPKPLPGSYQYEREQASSY